MKRRPIILDGDPGHDDAIAWVMAKALDCFDIKAITAVAGNQTLEKTSYNAGRIAALLNINVPIAKGKKVPLLHNLVTASNFHGESGLDGPVLPEPKEPLSDLPACALMAKVLSESEEKVTIIATGPTTNVAALLLAYPYLKEKMESICIMGGGLTKGNWSSAAEFNVIVDPEALDIVFKSGVPIIMCGLDVTEKALCYPEEYERIRQIDNPVAQVVAGWFDFFMKHLLSIGWKGATLHDPCCIAYLSHPELFKTKDVYCQVELSGQYTRGATVADFNGIYNQEPNVKAVMDIDREAFIELLIDCCKSYSKENDNE